MAQEIQVTIDATTQEIEVSIDPASLPPGGSTGQILTKRSNTSGDAYWSSTNGLTAPVDAASVDELLALPDGTWLRTRVFRTYGMAVLTIWEYLSTSNPHAGLVTPNGDSVLTMNDGLGYAIRTAVIPL